MAVLDIHVPHTLTPCDPSPQLVSNPNIIGTHLHVYIQGALIRTTCMYLQYMLVSIEGKSDITSSKKNDGSEQTKLSQLAMAPWRKPQEMSKTTTNVNVTYIPGWWPQITRYEAHIHFSPPPHTHTHTKHTSFVSLVVMLSGALSSAEGRSRTRVVPKASSPRVR